MTQREWADKNYYADLGVSSSATADEIKRAYRKLARDNHPDKHPGDKVAEERFKKVAEAYDVLGDDKKRKEYDELKDLIASGGIPGFGSGGFGGNSTGFGGGFRQAADFDVSDLFGGGRSGFSSDGSSFSDIFGGLFNRGGSGGGTPRNTARPTRGADVEADITLDFREATQGTTLPIQLTGEAPCTTCHGSGSKTGNPTACRYCNGTGFTSENQGAFGFSAPCVHCSGTGQVITDPCSDCTGTGTVHRTRTITVRIPPGLDNGQKVRLAGKGEAGPNGKPAGDLFVTVHVRPDPVFKRSGDDLKITVPVSFTDLALGGAISVPTLTTPVRVKVPAGTPNGRTLRVRGRGVPKRNGQSGDLLVTVDVKVPKNLSDGARAALEEYARLEQESGFDPRAGWVGNTVGSAT